MPLPHKKRFKKWQKNKEIIKVTLHEWAAEVGRAATEGLYGAAGMKCTAASAMQGKRKQNSQTASHGAPALQ